MASFRKRIDGVEELVLRRGKTRWLRRPLHIRQTRQPRGMRTFSRINDIDSKCRAHHATALGCRVPPNTGRAHVATAGSTASAKPDSSPTAPRCLEPSSGRVTPKLPLSYRPVLRTIPVLHELLRILLGLAVCIPAQPHTDGHEVYPVTNLLRPNMGIKHSKFKQPMYYILAGPCLMPFCCYTLGTLDLIGSLIGGPSLTPRSPPRPAATLYCSSS